MPCRGERQAFSRPDRGVYRPSGVRDEPNAPMVTSHSMAAPRGCGRKSLISAQRDRHLLDRVLCHGDGAAPASSLHGVEGRLVLAQVRGLAWMFARVFAGSVRLLP